MSEKKTIQINPELFKLSNKNTTKKKKPVEERPSIKIKSDFKANKQKTLRKTVMKMIREKQQDEYKKLFSDKNENRENNVNPTISQFNTEFDDSLSYFAKLNEKTNNDMKNFHNTTIKQYPNPQPNSILLQPSNTTSSMFIPTDENVDLNFPNDIISSPPIQIRKPNLFPQPKYGCLKNGNLPTYRNWMNHTQKNYPPINNTNLVENQKQNSNPMSMNLVENQTQNSNPMSMNLVENQKQNSNPMSMNLLENPNPNPNPIQQNNSLLNKQQMIEFMKKKQINENKILKKNNIRYLKRKKIYKRTYRVGRSKIAPKIGVLISNKTIRNRTTSQTHALRQIPIQEVRRYLVKKGFIKVGTSAPNDVLRKMYESVLLICGEVQNHNPENLLYNFINDTIQ